MPWSGDSVLQVSTVRDGTASVTIWLAGELDITSVAAARRAVADAEAGALRIVLDLSRVTFCDVAGARFLIGVSKLARAADTDLVVRYPQPRVSRVLDLTGALPLVFPGAGAGRTAPDPAVVSACAEAVAEAIRVSGADTGNAQLVDPASGVLRIVAQHGFGPRFLDFFDVVDDEGSACGSALAAAQPVWVPEVARSPIFAGTPAMDVMLDAGSRAVASLPVRGHDGIVMAMISVHYRRPTTWSEQQRQRLAAVAAVTARRMSALGEAPGPAESAGIQAG